MLTYQLHTRILKVPSEEEFTFPNKVTLTLKLSPGTAFGSKNEPSRTLLYGHEATISMNANTGRWLGQSKPPLSPLNVVITRRNSELSLKGDLLTYEFDCPSLSELNGALAAFKFIYPTILNLEFADPPIILHVSGRVGNVDFRWEHHPKEWYVEMRTITVDSLQQQVAKSFEELPLFNGTDNRRLAAALSYFHIAVRLNTCGDSPWEFMAETILNYCKAIEILFVTSENSRDDVRKELKKLGYAEEMIEGDFIPILTLRSYMDVAHPRVAIFKQSDLRVLYRYMMRSENVIRQFLRRVINKVNKEEYSIIQEDDLRLTPDDQKGMNKLVPTMKSRLKIPVP